MALNLGADFLVRPMDRADRGFVVSSWLRDLRDHSPYWRKMHPDDWQALMPLAVDALVDSGRVLLAVDPVAPDVIYAFLAYLEPHILFYAYTKRAWRRMGLQRALVTVSGLSTPYVCPYLTSQGEDALRQAGVGWHFNPLAVHGVLK